jgi:hypothetical protein
VPVLLLNLLPERLADELAIAQRLGVVPVEGAGGDLSRVVNQGTIKWIVTAQGRLLIVPKYVGQTEIAHTVASKGEPVLAAGEAEVAFGAGRYFGIAISNDSGHYRPSMESLRIGIDAFARLGITFP